MANKPGPRPTPKATAEQFCPLHLTIFPSGDQCKFHGVVPCPKPHPVDPATAIIATCNRCDERKLTVAGLVMQAKPMGERVCGHDNCAATFAALQQPNPTE